MVDKINIAAKIGDIESTLRYALSSMLGKIFEIGSIIKQAREFGGQVHEMNEKLKELRLDGTAAGGLVTVSVNGLQELVACKIDPSLFQQGDAELLEELIITAVNSAIEEARTQQADTMRTIAGNLDMSSLSGFIEKLSS